MQPEKVELTRCKLSWEKGGVSFMTVVDGCFSTQIVLANHFYWLCGKYIKNSRVNLSRSSSTNPLEGIQLISPSKPKVNHASFCKLQIYFYLKHVY